MSDEYLLELDRLLSEPLSSVRDREKSAFDRLLADCGKRIVLFGAGNLGRKVLLLPAQHWRRAAGVCRQQPIQVGIVCRSCSSLVAKGRGGTVRNDGRVPGHDLVARTLFPG